MSDELEEQSADDEDEEEEEQEEEPVEPPRRRRGRPRLPRAPAATLYDDTMDVQVMPEFYGSNTTLVETNKVQLLRLLASCIAETYDAAADEKSHAVLRELWGAHGRAEVVSVIKWL